MQNIFWKIWVKQVSIIGFSDRGIVAVRGDGDFLVSAQSLIALKNRISGSAFFNVPFAEHVVYQEQPEAVRIILEQFFC